jgi:Na+/proline symporter
MIWLILAAGVITFSYWGWRNASNTTAFFAASRSAGPFLAGLGGTAAGLSAFVFVGGPGLFAVIGAASLWIVLSAPITGALQCWAVGERIVEIVKDKEVLTVPGLVAARFGEGLPRALSALAVAVGGIATLGVQIKGTAIVGEVLLDVPGWWVALATLLATLAYTTAGGMRAGLVAEAVQGGIMGFSALAIAGYTLWQAGGPLHAIETVNRLKPELLGIWSSAGPTSGISLFLLFALGTCAQPHYLQKFLMLEGRESLRWLPAVMTASLIAVLTVWIGVGLGGVALWLDGGFVLSSPDQLTPTLLETVLPSWMTPLALIAIVAAVMSTAASLLNLVSASISHDLPLALSAIRGRQLSVNHELRWARLATLVTAVLALAIGLGTTRSIVWLGVLGWGTFTAALLPVMVIGLNWTEASRRGAILALIAGPAVQLALELWGESFGLTTSWEPGLSGAAVGCIVLVLMSPRKKLI